VKKLPHILIVFAAALLIFGSVQERSKAQENIIDTGAPGNLEWAKQKSLDILRDRALSRAIGSVDDFEVMRVETDDTQIVHTRVRQALGGVPVWEGEAIVHLRQNGGLFTITDDLKENVSVNTQANLTPDDAIAAAEGYYKPGAGSLTAKPKADIWIYRAEDRDHLVYRVQMERLDGTENTSMPVMFIDAHTGEKIFQYDNLQTGLAPTMYSGTVFIDTTTDGSTFYMEDTLRRLGTFNMNGTGSENFPYGGGTQSRFTSPTDSWHLVVQRAGVDAHWGAQKTFDYYQTFFGRYGINGNYGPGTATAGANNGVNLVVSRVHYGSSGAFNNAFWNGSQVSYGDGDGSQYGSFPALDICGHEITHGVIQSTAGLAYQKESGALNESWADVFGAMVELYGRGGGPPTSDTWKIGEYVKTPLSPGDAIRYMYHPPYAGDPDHYSTRLYQGTCAPSNTNDNCGVHSNSGIPNKAFYLVAAGGTHPKSGVTVVGIGVSKAQQIWYKALSYMTSGTNFAGARAATLNAASALYGPDEIYAVTRAWCAVGVGGCPDLLVNGTLEGTIVPWIGSGPGFFYTSKGNSPFRSDNGYIYLGVNDNATGQVYQTVSIPTTAVGRLAFSLNVTSQESSTRVGYDNMWFEVRDTSGLLLTHYSPYSNKDNMLIPWIYYQKSFNLSSFRGKTVRIQFTVKNDGSKPTVFRIDNVTLQ
jgi:thermolysin